MNYYKLMTQKGYIEKGAIYNRKENALSSFGRSEFLPNSWCISSLSHPAELVGFENSKSIPPNKDHHHIKVILINHMLLQETIGKEEPNKGKKKTSLKI